MQSSSSRLHSLDGLRAIAACLVVAHHLGVSNLGASLHASGHAFFGVLLPSVTASGVELFFVLSAIVLTRPYVSGQRSMLVGFYFIRRIERLWPPFLAAWLLAGIAVFVVERRPTWQTAGNAIVPFSFPGWLSQIGIVYVGDGSYNLTWWSLGVEVSFYALVPVLVVAFSSMHGRPRRLTLAYAGAVILATMSEAIGGPAGKNVLGSLIAYASCFCAGLVLACAVPSRRTATMLVTGGVVWVIAAAAFPRINMHVGWGLFYFGIVGLAMKPGRLSALLSGHGFVWLGERSYSLFLVHYSVIILVYWAASELLPRGPAYFAMSRGLALFGSFAATTLVFHFVERRFARGLVTAGELFPGRTSPR